MTENKTPQPAQKREPKGLIDALVYHRPTQILALIIIGIFVIGYFVYGAMTAKPMGTWRYGICKTYIELRETYPSSVKIIAAGEKPTEAFIYFSNINAFGDQSLHFISCIYDQNDAGALIMSAVELDENPEPQDRVDGFSSSIPYLMTLEMDLQLPSGFTNQIKDIKNYKSLKLDDVYIY